jgi:hypothetical protein
LPGSVILLVVVLEDVGAVVHLDCAGAQVMGEGEIALLWCYWDFCTWLYCDENKIHSRVHTKMTLFLLFSFCLDSIC